MKSNLGRFSILNRRAEYLKLKEKEKKKEENVEELEEDEEEDKNNKNIQKPKNIPITKTPLIPNTSLNRLDKQKLLSNSTSYNFTKSRINYASNNNNTKDLLIMRQGQEKKLQIMGTKSSNDITNNSKQSKCYRQAPALAPGKVSENPTLRSVPPKAFTGAPPQTLPLRPAITHAFPKGLR